MVEAERSTRESWNLRTYDSRRGCQFVRFYPYKKREHAYFIKGSYLHEEKEVKIYRFHSQYLQTA